MNQVGTISAVELKRAMDEGMPLVLLDVREDEERAICALPARDNVADYHIPLRLIPRRYGEVMIEGRPVIVYCHHGVRSLTVVHWFAGQGVPNVFNLEGGIDAWSIFVDPHLRRY